MTNEEAIEIIQTEWKCVDRNDGIHCDRKCENCDLVLDVREIREAYNVAIRALKNEQTDGVLISKQEVINAIQRVRNHNAYDEIEEIEKLPIYAKEDTTENLNREKEQAYYKGFEDGRKMLLDEINKLPSAEKTDTDHYRVIDTSYSPYTIDSTTGLSSITIPKIAEKTTITDGDLISRKAVLKCFNIRELKFKNKEDAELVKHYLELAFDDLANLPSVKVDGDLISRGYIIQQIQKAKENNYNFNYNTLIDFIKVLPSAERTAELRIVGETTMHYECSLCGGAVDKWDKFCKTCGAKIKEESEDKE